MKPYSNPFMNLIAQFEQFKKEFKGNPQEVVQQLLDSGKMTQEQFNQLKQMADFLAKGMK